MGNKRFGDRRDAVLLRDLDAMHFIMPLVLPNRCDNEAFISERIDLTNLNAYLAERNKTEEVFPYTLFHLIVTAMIKTVTLRPKLNRFIANKNFYQRNEVSAAFVVKKLFADNGEEALAFLRAAEDDTLESLHEKLYQQVSLCRSEQLDTSSNSMDIINKLPRFVSKALVRLLTLLDRHGRLPGFLCKDNPYYSTIFLSNLGSIKLKSGYHHLANFGTNSLFLVVGEKKRTPVYANDGTYTMTETVDLGITIDERLADGYYYAKSIRLLKTLLQNPQLLEKPMNEAIEY